MSGIVSTLGIDLYVAHAYREWDEISVTRLVIADYQNHCDRDGKPIGHSSKVLREYVHILEDRLDITIMAHESYLDCLCSKNKATKTRLFLFVDIMTIRYIKKIKNVFVRLINLFYIFHRCKNEILWFYNTDYLLYFYIVLLGKKNNKIICTLCQGKYASNCTLKDKLQNYFLYKVLDKVDVLVKTNLNIQLNHKNILFVPDYYYANEVYDHYRQTEKKDIIACVGTMSTHKLLEELVSVAKDIGVTLIIIGTFNDMNRLNSLNAAKSENIIIQNKHLSYDEYYEILSTAKFSILPYSESIYDERTSGILIESIFLNTIPIAPKVLLEFNNIKGVGYSSLDELKKIRFGTINTDEYKHIYEHQINSIYNKDWIANSLVDAVKSLI